MNRSRKTTLMQLQWSLPKRIITTAVIMIALILIVFYFNVPNPNMILIPGLVLCSAIFGFGGGIVAAVIMFGYTLFFFSTDYSFTEFTPQNLQKVWVSLIGIGADMLLVCFLKAAEVRAFREIDELNRQVSLQKESLSALLDNMPSLNFSKDAETGVYLYCNQSFAEYANRPSPAETVGLTDYEIFDAETAKHFVEDDRKALSMSEPHVFFEDVIDAKGGPRHFQTTKLEFYDSSGRRTLLGMCLDITELRRIQEERKSYLRFSAFYGNLIEMYFVDPETGQYMEYVSEGGYDAPDDTREGSDFFRDVYENSLKTLHPEDMAMFHAQVTRENILNMIRQDGFFVLDYRQVSNGLPTYVRMKAAEIEEDGRKMLIIGLLDEDARIRQEQAYARDLSVARKMAIRDSLTGVKNKHAYVEWEEQINERIEKGEQEPFAVVVCDVNNLKAVNDLYGHKEGDECIRKACRRICDVFKHSPVFRVGGDEFVVLLTGEDYGNRAELTERVSSAPEELSRIRIGETISAGMAEYQKGVHDSLLSLFEEADRAMYENKEQMKARYSGLTK